MYANMCRRRHTCNLHERTALCPLWLVPALLLGMAMSMKDPPLPMPRSGAKRPAILCLPVYTPGQHDQVDMPTSVLFTLAKCVLACSVPGQHLNGHNAVPVVTATILVALLLSAMSIGPRTDHKFHGTHLNLII